MESRGYCNYDTKKSGRFLANKLISGLIFSKKIIEAEGI